MGAWRAEPQNWHFSSQLLAKGAPHWGHLSASDANVGPVPGVEALSGRDWTACLSSHTTSHPLHMAALPAGRALCCITREQNGHRASPLAAFGTASSVHRCSARPPSSWRRTAMVSTVPPQAVQTYWRSPLTWLAIRSPEHPGQSKRSVPIISLSAPLWHHLEKSRRGVRWAYVSSRDRTLRRPQP